PPEAFGQPLPERVHRLILCDLECDHSLGCEHLCILLFSQLLRAAERAAERLSRSVVTHRGAAPFAGKVVRGELGVRLLLLSFRLRSFGSAVGAEQVLLVEEPTA